MSSILAERRDEVDLTRSPSFAASPVERRSWDRDVAAEETVGYATDRAGSEVADGDDTDGAAAGGGAVGIAGMLASLSSDALRHAIADIDPAVLGEALDGLGEGHVRAVMRVASVGLDSEGLLAVVDDTITLLAGRILDAAVPDVVLHDSVAALQRLGARLEGEKLRRISEITGRASHLGDAARTTMDLLRRFGLTSGEAREQVHTATALSDMPKTAQKVADGDLTARQASDVARKRREMDDLATANGADDTALAAQRDALDNAAAATPAGSDRNRLRDRLDAAAAAHAPDQLAQREQRAHRNRRLTITPGKDGTARIDGYGPAAVIAKFGAMIDALARPDGAKDPRSQPQRNFDALAHLSDRYLAEGHLPDVAAQQAHIIVTIPRDALLDLPDAEPAHLHGYGAISNATARMLTCDAEITTLIAGPDGEPLAIGRASRTPTTAQRRAVIARDRTCIGCGAPATRCQIHHIRYWRNGGPTDVTNLALLCWNCHTHIHHHQWTITQDADGRRHAGPPGHHPGVTIDHQHPTSDPPDHHDPPEPCDHRDPREHRNQRDEPTRRQGR